MGQQEYMSGMAALRGFLEKLFVVFTIGVVLVFVMIRSEVIASPARVSSLPTGDALVAAMGADTKVDLWLGRPSGEREPSRGQGEH